jgi:hypothetical protein
MYIFKVKVRKLEDNYLIIKYISGDDVKQIDHVAFTQLLVDENGN